MLEFLHYPAAIQFRVRSFHRSVALIMLIGIDIRRSEDFGVGTYIRNLVRGLSRVGRDEEYALIGHAGQFGKLDELPPNFRFEVCPHRFDSARNQVSFPLLLRRLGLDVFHMPHRSIPYFLPGPYVVTLHDISNVLYPVEKPSRWLGAIRRHAMVRGLKRAARIMPVSKTTKRDAIKYLGLNEVQLTVVPDAVDPRIAQPVKDEERTMILDRYQIRDPFVLYAGRIQPHKNIPRLIEAFAVIKKELENHPHYHNLRLIIIGDQVTAMPEVRLAVMKARIQNWVRFLGFVPAETLRVFYAAARVFLFPSLYEGFGLPPLEAMAQGTPVVTSNVSSLPEVVGTAAVLVNPQNVFDIARGLREALLDEALREDLRRRGYAQTQQFSWDESVRRVLEVYRSVTLAQ